MLVLRAPSIAAEVAGGPTSTPLPVGWELCVLAGIQAPATPQNVSALDAWQTAEGGSTDNANAYNPFNTKRSTDPNGMALPLETTVDGFPAFSNWSAGCSATVATIEQPDMTPILAALRQGSVLSPAMFLVMVDATPWCTPAKGEPCYAALIAAGGIDVEATAISMYHDATQALEGYNQAVSRVASDQATLGTEALQLQDDDTSLDSAEHVFAKARSALAALAISQYATNPQTNADPTLRVFAGQSVSGALATYYDGLDVTRQVRIYQAAESALGIQRAGDRSEQAQVQASAAALVADQTAAAGALAALEVQLASLQAAGVCVGISALAGANTATLDSCLGSLAPPTAPPTPQPESS